MIIDVEEIYTVGINTYLGSAPDNSEFGVTFEDNEETGYFYAVILKPEMKIVDALHIYNVGDVVNKEKPCKIQIVWSDDFTIASLLINSYCHAVFDFVERAGLCRNAFPENQSGWATSLDRMLTEQRISVLFLTKGNKHYHYLKM